MSLKKILQSILRHRLVLIMSFSGVIMAGVFFGSGYCVGFYNSRPIKLEENKTLPLVGIEQGTSTELLDADFSLFWDALKIAKEKYVRIDEVEDQDFLYGAINGAINALGDPYSVFFKPVDAKKFEEDIKGSFGGIGAEIGIRNEQLIIISPLKGNPAEEEGLKAGDKILKVDDKFTSGLSVDEAVKMIRGEPGTIVILLIMRDSWTETKEFKIKRRLIVVPTLDWKMLSSGEQEDIAYIQLYNFNSNASSLFYKAVLSALIKGTRGVVLDLRNNSGGYLDVAIDISGWFLDKGLVVTEEKFRSGETNSLVARGNGALKNIPVVVLVNEGSASASEILAGALRDNRGVKLIGMKTFGKGSVQELENLKDGSTLKISIAEWLTPKGHSIEKAGLEPDIEIKPDLKAQDENDEKKNKNDVQFEKALEVLKKQLSPERAVPTFILEL